MVDEVDLVAVVVTDKNGRTSRRWKRPENVKPSDVVITDEAEMPKRPGAAATTKKAPSKAAKRTPPKKAAPPPPALEAVVPDEKWDTDTVLTDSGIASLVAVTAAGLFPAGTLVSYELRPARVDFLVTDLFGYESVIVMDFEKCLTITAEGDVPTVEIVEGVEPLIFRLEGAAFVATFGYGERRLFTLLAMTWDAVVQSKQSFAIAA